MNFHFNEEEQEILDMLHDYAVKEVAPRAHEIDEEEKFPMEARNGLAEMGMMGMYFPEEYGGAGLSYLSYIAVCEELAVHCATTSVVLSAHESLCSWPIYKYGTEEQKKKYLTALASGEKLGAFGLTEPGAGTDAAMQKTVAKDEGDHWVLNGSKVFITNAQYADIFVVFAMVYRPDYKENPYTNHDISAFIIEKGFEGFSVQGHEMKMGIRGSSTYELIFQDCRIPKDALLGPQGKGFPIAMHTLDGGRIGIAAQALGLAEGALDRTIEYTKERKQFGRTIAQQQNTQFQLADMATKVEAAKNLVYRAALKKQEFADGAKVSYSVEAAMAKLCAAEVAMEVTTKAVQLHGGYGYIREYDVERMMRDAKITEIYEGTSEVQRMVISGALLK